MVFYLSTPENISNITLKINLSNELVDGGIYMFLIDNIPLYIGEANYFLDRLSTHISKLVKATSGNKHLDYFGLSNITGKHIITYMILEPQLPYIKKNNNNKRSSDANKSERTTKEANYIEEYHPLTQWPIWLSKKEYKTIRCTYKTRKRDDMLPIELRNNMVNIGLTKNISLYSTIISKLHTP
ncbi:MAG: hypothetical protein IJA34_09240 [Lachnospiraceae bacterium]|nr:hypothetical protein [Lachnospiraceae bacterium]